jgi:hypothetical protein
MDDWPGRIGVAWVGKYNDLDCDLDNTEKQARGFYDTLKGVRVFEWGDPMPAHDRDFEQNGVGDPLDGADEAGVETVDFVYFSGHGSPSGFRFGLETADDGMARFGDIRWGDGTLKWVAIDACDVLSSVSAIGNWGQVFRGLHIIVGFSTTASDEAERGRLFAHRLNDGWTVIEAWVRACEETESSDTEWAYLRVGGPDANTADDHWLGAGTVSADPRPPMTLHYLNGAC